MLIHITKEQINQLVIKNVDTVFFESEPFSDKIFLIAQDEDSQIKVEIKVSEGEHQMITKYAIPVSQIKALSKVVNRYVSIKINSDLSTEVYLDSIGSEASNIKIPIVLANNDEVNNYPSNQIKVITPITVVSREMLSHNLKKLVSPSYNSVFVEVAELTEDKMMYLSSVILEQTHSLNLDFSNLDSRVIFPFSAVSRIIKFIKDADTVTISVSEIEDADVKILNVGCQLNGQSSVFVIELYTSCYDMPQIGEDNSATKLFALSVESNDIDEFSRAIDSLAIPVSSISIPLINLTLEQGKGEITALDAGNNLAEFKFTSLVKEMNSTINFSEFLQYDVFQQTIKLFYFTHANVLVKDNFLIIHNKSESEETKAIIPFIDKSLEEDEQSED